MNDNSDLNYHHDGKDYTVKFSCAGNNTNQMDSEHYVMMVVTPSSIRSEGCLKDLNRADELGCPVIALMEDGTEFTEEVTKDRFVRIIKFDGKNIIPAYKQAEAYIEELEHGK